MAVKTCIYSDTDRSLLTVMLMFEETFCHVIYYIKQEPNTYLYFIFTHLNRAGNIPTL